MIIFKYDVLLEKQKPGGQIFLLSKESRILAWFLCPPEMVFPGAKPEFSPSGYP